MVYKIGNVKDLNTLPLIDETAKAILYRYVHVLSKEYGEERDTDRNDGGYVLYVPPHIPCENIKTYFDYSKHTAECVELHGEICSAMYLLNNEYMVIIVMWAVDVPAEIAKEIDNK